MVKGRGVDRDPGCQPVEVASPHTSELASRLADQVHAKRQCRGCERNELVAGVRSDRNE